MKNIWYFLQTIIFIFIAMIGYLLPFKVGSALGGFLMRNIGRLAAKLNTVARHNLNIAFPTISAQAAKDIISAMWTNLGSNLFEYFRLHQQNILNNQRYHIKGKEFLQQVLQQKNGGIFFSAHYGNWELGTFTARQYGAKIHNITRFINNPYLRTIINKIHSNLVDGLIPKGKYGAKKIITVLKKKEYISLLMDQKLNEGKAINFFNKPAMTATAIAKLAIKFQIPIIPFQVIRRPGCEFDIIYCQPIYAKNFANNEVKILEHINQQIETWIKAHPHMWFWVHKRWEKAEYILS